MVRSGSLYRRVQVAAPSPLRQPAGTIEMWETKPKPCQLITPAIVREARMLDRLAEDMDLELSELFSRPAGLPARRGRHIAASGTLFH